MSSYSISLDFFDIPVDLNVGAVDVRDARWFFGRHLRPDPASEARISVSCSPGLFASLLDHSGTEKSLSMRDENGSRTVRFTKWSSAPSFLPQFASETFTRRYAMLHGSAVVAPNGGTLLLLGGNYVGKTATSLELLKRGWSLVSDSCVVLDFIDPARPVLRRYETPFGFRRATLARWSDRLAKADSRQQLSRATGPVVLAHAGDVITDLACTDRVPASVVVYLDDGSGESAPGPVLRVYPGHTSAQVSGTLERLPRRTIRDAGHVSAPVLADELEHVVTAETAGSES